MDSFQSLSLLHRTAGVVDFVGNRTECALLVLARKLGHDYAQLREARAADVLRVHGFSSARKMASVVVRELNGPPGGQTNGPPDVGQTNGPLRLYNKGAAEWVLAKCTSVLGPSGELEHLTEPGRDSLLEVVTQMATRGLRCICLAYRDLPQGA